jgi:hypothetical protein
MDFFSGSVDQCAAGMIEKGAGNHVNPGGMMVTWFGYHCKREGQSSNPGATLNFFEHWNCKQEGHSSNPRVTQVLFFFFCSVLFGTNNIFQQCITNRKFITN